MKKVIAILSLLLVAGCGTIGCTTSPIVHPTDDQIMNSNSNGKTNDESYIPWWAEQE